MRRRAVLSGRSRGGRVYLLTMSRDGRTFGRYVTSATLTAGLALGGLVVPVVPLPVQAATPVSPEIDSVRLAAVDRTALADPSADDLPAGHVHDDAGASGDHPDSDAERD